MDYIFTGDKNGHGPELIKLFGYEFPKGKAVTVDDESASFKLSNNGHFKSVSGVKTLDQMTKGELEIEGRKYGIELDRRKSVTTLIKQVQEAIDADQD